MNLTLACKTLPFCDDVLNNGKHMRHGYVTNTSTPDLTRPPGDTPIKTFLSLHPNGRVFFASPHPSDRTATGSSDVVQYGRPIFDDFFQHLWPSIGNNTANVVLKWSSVCDLSA
ncbi:hypothetical protein TNCV_604561 [Trichonephila clavipes]|nr:hypothetical protein TNCV_604561 [Trichonephila clavipes]